MISSFSPEFQLAAACAMWPPSDRRNEAVCAVAAGPLDWPRFLRVAERHQIMGLVNDGLVRAQAIVPEEIAREIGARAATLVRENLLVAHEALRLQRLFEDAAIPVLFIKGASLAVLAFGNLGLRSAQDIDLLVPLEALATATTLLARSGYRRLNPPPDISDAQLRLLIPLRKDLGFVHAASGLHVELHWRLFLNPHAMSEASVAVSRVVPLTGTNGLRTLGEEDLFAYLCMHGALHWWNRLKWLADINALMAATPPGGVDRSLRAAEARGAGRAAVLAMMLCQRVLGAAIYSSTPGKGGNGFVMGWLETTAVRTMTIGQGERDPHAARFGTTRGSLSTYLLSSSWRYRLAELNIHLTNQTDVQTMQLPEFAWFLYSVLRLPLWVWRHAGKRGAGDDRK
jgi:Uncharacterised nucleotidyltransferase